jgi:hypothetical protein
VIISNGLGGITSTPVTLTVSYVTINAFLADAEVTAGQPVIFVVTAVGTHGTTLTYVWHVVAAGQAVGSGGDQVIPGQTLSAYEILSADSSIDGEMIYVVVSNGLGGTGVATSEPVTLLVD